jgi:hypothetical protein
VECPDCKGELSNADVPSVVVCKQCSKIWKIEYGPLRLEPCETSVIVDPKTIHMMPGEFSVAYRNSWGEGYGIDQQSHALAMTNATPSIVTQGPEKWVKPLGPYSLADFFVWCDGITPYMCCPWCNYIDVNNEFGPYTHPYDHSPEQARRGSTECGQCSAAGPTALFILAHDPKAELYDCEKYREMYLSQLEFMELFSPSNDWQKAVDEIKESLKEAKKTEQANAARRAAFVKGKNDEGA